MTATASTLFDLTDAALRPLFDYPTARATDPITSHIAIDAGHASDPETVFSRSWCQHTLLTADAAGRSITTNVMPLRPKAAE